MTCNGHATLSWVTLGCADTGINTGLSIVGSSGGGNQTCSNTLVLFSMYTLESLGRGNQPQGVGSPYAPIL